MKHFHQCICGAVWPCTINILALPDKLGAIRCERWPNTGACDQCMESILAGKDSAEVAAILNSMAKLPDALLAAQARVRIAAT